MAASVSIRCYTATDAGTESAAISGIDLISADNATNTTANRQTNPITAGNKSYEKWLKAYVDTAPDNAVDNFQIWGDGAVQATTDLFIGKTATGVTPTSGDSTVATNDFTSQTAGNKFAWHATDLTGAGSKTDFIVMQMDVGATCAAGNWTQETLSYSLNVATLRRNPQWKNSLWITGKAERPTRCKQAFAVQQQRLSEGAPYYAVA